MATIEEMVKGKRAFHMPDLEESPVVHYHEFARTRETNPAFYELLVTMARTHNAKGHDYAGAGNDPLANLRASEELGIPAWKGTLIRMADKWSRLRNFARVGALQVKDESFVDTCLDLAVYCLHVIVLFREVHETPSA